MGSKITKDSPHLLFKFNLLLIFVDYVSYIDDSILHLHYLLSDDRYI